MQQNHQIDIRWFFLLLLDQPDPQVKETSN